MPDAIAPRPLGRSGPQVYPIGLGCMSFSGMYGAYDAAAGVDTIHAALDAGVTLLDTGDFYGVGANELIVGRALQGRRTQALLSVKFGALRDPAGAFLGYDARPAAVKNFLAYSLTRLNTDYVDIYRPSRLDPAVPIEDTIGAIADLVKAGYVRHIGLSEVGAETIRRAAKVHPIVDLQIEYSLVSRGPEAEIRPALDALDIGMTAYGVLSRGLLTGSRPRDPKDLRAHLPRFTGAAGAANQRLAQALADLAAAKQVSPAQLAIAWVLSRGRNIVPLIGARTRAQLADALGAVRVRLSPAELAALEGAVPAEAVQGTRYPAALMTHLDSERGGQPR
jgi:aryl-alcohol dehydrogenase-like predicted oxidoreductase